MITVISEFLPEDNKITHDPDTMVYCQPPVGYRRLKPKELNKGLVQFAAARLKMKKPFGYNVEFIQTLKEKPIQYVAVCEWHYSIKKGKHYSITIYIKL